MQNNRLYKRLGMAIEINLHYKGYLVRANQLKIGGKESNTYEITLELQRSDIGKWDTLNKEVFVIESKNINTDTAHFVLDKFAEGYFKPSIDRYEYEVNCENVGIELEESERSGVSC